MNNDMMDADYNIARMEWIVKKDQGGKALSQEQKAEIANIKKRYDAASAAMKEHEQRILEEQRKTEEMLKNAYAEVKFAEARAAALADPGRKASPIRQRMLSWADETEARVMARIKARAGRASLIEADPVVLADMAELGAVYMVRGVFKLSDWTARMRSVFTDATDEDLRKALEMAKATAEAEKARAAAEILAEPGRKVTSWRKRMLSWADRMEAEAIASIRGRGGK
jgi:hypothetical protein